MVSEKQPPSKNDWREKRMAQVRQLIQEADPDVVEEQKYKMPSRPEGIPVWYHDGMICTGETYTKHLRLTFSKAEELKDHDLTGLFNRHSAIVIEENDELDEAAFKKLIQAAVKINEERKSKKGSKKAK